MSVVSSQVGQDAPAQTALLILSLACVSKHRVSLKQQNTEEKQRNERGGVRERCRGSFYTSFSSHTGGLD